MSKENFELFQRQSRQLLDQLEMNTIKTALSLYLQEKNLKELVETLVEVLDTDAKARMLPTIGNLIPPSKLEEYNTLIIVYRRSPVDVDDYDDAEIDPFAEEVDPFAEEEEDDVLPDDVDPFEGLTEQEIQMKILDDPSLAEKIMKRDEEKERKKLENPFRGLSQETIAKMIMDDPSLAQYDLDDDDDQEESMFDLVIRMAEADLKGDTRTKRDAEAKIKRSSSIAQNSSQRQPQKKQEEPKRPFEIGLPDYLCSAGSRSEARAFLQMARPEHGLFLVRKKDTSIAGSFKRKPGQKLPYRMWALSYIDADKSLKNVLLEQKEKGGAIFFGSTEIKNTSNPHQALMKMSKMKEFKFTRTPFQCRRWYHGLIDRKECETRLSGHSDGSFLVRKSTREDGMYVLSVMAKGKVYHNKVKNEGGSWVAASSPQQMFGCLSDLITHHKSTSFGLTALTAPIPRPEPFQLDDEDGCDSC